MTKYRPEWVAQALKDGNHPFFVTIPIVKNFIKQDGTEIVGLGSKVSRSRTGHKMLQPFIEKMRTTAVGRPLLINHNPDQVAGTVTKVMEGGADEFVPVSQLLTPHENQIVDAPRAKVEHWIENKVQLGYSIGGMASKAKMVKEDGKPGLDIADGEIVEVSITPINALRESDGTVTKIANSTCQDGVCGQIAQQIINGPNLPDLEDFNQSVTQDSQIRQSTGYVLNQTAVDNAEALIEAGSIDFDTPWNRGSYEWGGNQEELQQYCIGLDPTSRDMEDSYRYRIGADGVIYKQAVIAVMDNAEAKSDIYSVADALLQLIYAQDTQTSLGQAVNDELNNDQLEDSNMEDNELKQAVKLLLDDRAVEVKKRKDAELRQEIASELKESVAEQVKNELKEEMNEEMESFKQATMESAQEIIQETLGLARKNKTHIQESTVGNDLVKDKVLGGEEEEGSTEVVQDFRDPSKYPAVVNGQVVQGMTPAQIFPK